LVLIILGVSIQQIAVKAYNTNVSGRAYTFTAISTLFAMLVFFITSNGKLNFNPQIIAYSIIFAISFCAANVFFMLSIKTGPLSLSALINQYAPIIPTLYGLIVLSEPLKVTLLLGIILLVISLFLINFEKKKDERTITLKWIIYSLLAFLGNGFCSVIQKIQQMNFDGLYKSEFMIVALAITTAFLFVMAFLTEKEDIPYILKKGFVYYLIRGIANGVVNFLVLYLSLKMPASVLFPAISAGGIITTCTVAMTYYKEKLSRPQTVGLIIGTIAIVALNL